MLIYPYLFLLYLNDTKSFLFIIYTSNVCTICVHRYIHICIWLSIAIHIFVYIVVYMKYKFPYVCIFLHSHLNFKNFSDLSPLLSVVNYLYRCLQWSIKSLTECVFIVIPQFRITPWKFILQIICIDVHKHSISDLINTPGYNVHNCPWGSISLITALLMVQFKIQMRKSTIQKLSQKCT